MKSDLDWMGQRKLSRRANGGNKIGMIFLWPKNVYERLKLVAAEQWPYNLANSVIRLGDFWKFLAINFLTKETSYLATFWAFLKTSLVSINCVGLAAFWVIFGNIVLLLIPISWPHWSRRTKSNNRVDRHCLRHLRCSGSNAGKLLLKFSTGSQYTYLCPSVWPEKIAKSL